MVLKSVTHLVRARRRVTDDDLGVFDVREASTVN